ncbi:hypothetical protein HK405_012177 [Cladochytrium tenue]|nr:hypothetical protein HK405_012177 [Cladochytrium tenue]
MIMILVREASDNGATDSAKATVAQLEEAPKSFFRRKPSVGRKSTGSRDRAPERYALVIDGHALKYAMEVEGQALFLELATQALTSTTAPSALLRRESHLLETAIPTSQLDDVAAAVGGRPAKAPRRMARAQYRRESYGGGIVGDVASVVTAVAPTVATAAEARRLSERQVERPSSEAASRIPVSKCRQQAVGTTAGGELQTSYWRGSRCWDGWQAGNATAVRSAPTGISAQNYLNGSEPRTDGRSEAIEEEWAIRCLATEAGGRLLPHDHGAFSEFAAVFMAEMLRQHCGVDVLFPTGEDAGRSRRLLSWLDSILTATDLLLCNKNLFMSQPDVFKRLAIVSIILSNKIMDDQGGSHFDPPVSSTKFSVMAASSPSPSNPGTPAASARQDVIQFLEDLDTIVPAGSQPGASGGGNGAVGASSAATAASASTVATNQEDVLSFLDELAHTASGSGQTSAAPPSKLQQPGARRTSAAPTSPRGFGAGPAAQPGAIDPTSGAAAATEPSGSWSWGSLWTTAQATVSAATATSIKMAEAMVEETTKAVTSDKVKGLVAEVSSNVSKSVSGVVGHETVGKLSTDFSKLTHSISDVLAPPINRLSSSGAWNRPLVLANSATIWLCPHVAESSPTQSAETETTEDSSPQKEPEGDVSEGIAGVGKILSAALKRVVADDDGPVGVEAAADRVHDFVQSTANSVWLASAGGGLGRRLCRRVTVNSVMDPSPKTAGSLDEAIRAAELTLTRLYKLAKENGPADAEEDGAVPLIPGVPAHATVFIVVQPFATVVESNMLGSSEKRQFLALLVCPDAWTGSGSPAAAGTPPVDAVTAFSGEGVEIVTGISNAVQALPAVAATSGAPTPSAAMRKWHEEQAQRAVETVLVDLIEEFAVRLRTKSAPPTASPTTSAPNGPADGEAI